MIKSMTGFGVGEGVFNDDSIRVEIRSLNSRYFDFSTRLPYLLLPYEAEIKRTVHTKVQRGKVTLSVSLNKTNGSSEVVLNEERAIFFLNSLKNFAKKNKLKGHLEVKDILTFPDLFVEKSKKVSSSALKKAVLPLIKEAAVQLIKMREKEGVQLSKDLLVRTGKIEKFVFAIEKIAKKEPDIFKKRLLVLIKGSNENEKFNQDRLEQEIAILADKADITEELVRLKSHCNLFKYSLDSDSESGKRLEFISQEMHREANTIGSKSQNAGITQNVIAIKLEIEKIREQVQNIE